MEKLAYQIKQQHSNDALIEIYVLNEGGVPLEIYTGLPSQLTGKIFSDILVDPGTFYLFSVVSIDESYAELLDLNRNKMSRREFCWLTEPLPPKIVSRTEQSVTLSWEPVRFCGVDVSVVRESMTYKLEGYEGQQWRKGISSKYVSSVIADKDFKVLCQGPCITNVELDDLEPSNFYHFRLCFEYAEMRAKSDSIHINTLCAVPSRPSLPKVSLVTNDNPLFSRRGRFAPKLNFTWGALRTNGSPIICYNVQLMEIFDADFASAEITDDERAYIYDQGTNTFRSKWRTVYCNLGANARLGAPSEESCIRWLLRYRAKNSSGWSPYSDTVELNVETHPTLFNVAPVEYEASPLGTKLPSIDSFRPKTTGGVGGRDQSLLGFGDARPSSFTSPVRSKEHSSPSRSPTRNRNEHAMNQNNAAANAVISSLHSSSRDDNDQVQQKPKNNDIDVNDPCFKELLETEVTRLWNWTSLNKDYIQRVIGPVLARNN